MNKPLHSRLYTDMLRVDIRTNRIIQDRRLDCYWKIKLWNEEHHPSPYFSNQPH